MPCSILKRRRRPALCAEREASSTDSPESDSDTFGAVGLPEPASGRRPRRRQVKRILDRDGVEFQSRGVFHVVQTRRTCAIFLLDFFHTVIHLPFPGLFIVFLIVYFACFSLFAMFWFWFSDPCGIGIRTYRDAFYLSVETQMTIGYGVPDPNFNECWEAAVLIVLQTVIGLMLDATVIGIVFQKLSNANARANTVIFSDTALLEVEDGCVYLRFRVADMSWRPLSQATMQVYCVQHHRDSSQPRGIRVELAAVQLEEPDTDIHNGIIFLGLPAMVSHKIDNSSPLAPDVEPGTPGCPIPADVREYLSQSPYLEILVLLSGTEESTGSVIEARHSYTLDDMFWNRYFGTCVSINADGYHCVDFHAIHHTYANSVVPNPTHAIAHGISHTFPARLDDNVEDSDAD
eukprot:gb/GFBE01030808.1/.p1 GENE.gb/GFBE01030808.1/~~gb/GFBE01030808.1/.p1  ORF type:complete len:404 (+),score=47.03 gb/GFBE01030808.1/:1-1212(+)